MLKLKRGKTGTVNLSGHAIDYTIQRSRTRKSYRLSFRQQDGLILHIPYFFTSAEIEQLLHRHRRWILNRVTQQAKPLPFRFEHGARLPLLKESYKLSLRAHAKKYLLWKIIDGHTLEISLPALQDDWIYVAIEDWYREMARAFLSKRLADWAEKMDVCFSKFFIKSQRTVWGSCSRKTNLNFNWRIMLLEPAEADYLIIHELCHLKELNHSRKFWRSVEKYCPDFMELKKQLKDKGYLLRFPDQILPSKK